MSEAEWEQFAFFVRKIVDLDMKTWQEKRGALLKAMEDNGTQFGWEEIIQWFDGQMPATNEIRG